LKNHLETCFILTQFNVYSNSKVNFNLLSNYFGDAANLACGRMIKSPETEHDKAVIEWLLKRLETVRPAAGEREKAMSAYENYGRRILNNIGKDVFVGAITIFDDNYPAILREIPAPPLVIYAAGAGYDRNADSLAVVGTRKPSTYALGQCKKFCVELSELKINIVSGLAAGIDSCAHKAALDGDNTTFAVLGSGFDIIFPPSNLSLYENIIKNGAVISEYLPGSAPAKYTFIFRNRIISGLSKGVLVAAAGEKSGALITAKYASEQNREVFSLCGDMTRGDFGGCHNIIKNHNAKLVTNIADILDEVDFKAASKILKKNKKMADLSALNADENLVYKVINSLEKKFEGGQAPIDNIFEEINGRLDNSAVLVILSKLEIEGFINTFFGKRYETVK